MKRASLLVAVLALLTAAAAFAAPAAPAPAASLAVVQPAPAPSPATAITTKACLDFCSRAYCVQGTTCGQNAAGQCGCWPDSTVSSGF